VNSSSSIRFYSDQRPFNRNKLKNELENEKA